MQYSDKNTICALYLFWVSTEQGMSVDSGGVLPIVLMHKCRVTWNFAQPVQEQRRFRVRADDGRSASRGVESVAEVPHRINGLAVGGPVFAGGVCKLYRLWAWNRHEGCGDVRHRYGIQWALRRHGSENPGNLRGNSSTRRHCLCAHATCGVFWIYQWAWRLSLCWSGNTKAVQSFSLLLSSVWCWLKFLTIHVFLVD